MTTNITRYAPQTHAIARASLFIAIGTLTIFLVTYVITINPQTCQTTVLRETRQTETMFQRPTENQGNNNRYDTVLAPVSLTADPATVSIVKIERNSLVREIFNDCIPPVAAKE